MTKRSKAKGRADKGKNIAPHDAVETSTDQKCPFFSFEYLQPAFCISNCTQEQKAAFVDMMRSLSRLTWVQIKSVGRHIPSTHEVHKANLSNY